MSANPNKNSSCDSIVEAVVFGPFQKPYLFLYCATETEGPAPRLGARIWVPFGNSFRMAIATRVNLHSTPEGVVLKTMTQVLDGEN